MKKLIASVVSSLVLASTANAGSLSFSSKKESNAPVVAASSNDVIVLTPDNLVVFRGEVQGASISKAIEQISNVKSNDVYLYLSTPGGSVVDGLQLVDFLLTTPKRVTCIVNFAASMGFVLTQACSTRIIQQSGVLMQHEASWGLRNQPEPHALSFAEFLRNMTEQMKRAEADRMGISYEDYRAKTRNDLWLFGQQAVTAGAVDAVKGVLCDARLFQEVDTEILSNGFMTAKVSWSKCPLITEPKEVKIGGFGGVYVNDLQSQSFAAKLQRYLDRNYINISGSITTRDFGKLELNDLTGN